MPPIVKGANIVEQLGPATWSTSDGWRTTKVFTGSHTAIEQFINDVQLLGCESLAIEREPDVSRLTAVFAWNQDVVETPEDVWELIGNTIDKSIYEHHTFTAFPNDVQVTLKKYLRYVEDGKNANGDDFLYADAIAGITTTCDLNGISPTLPIAFFDLTVRGTDSYRVPQYVLRKTQLVSSRYQLKISHTGVFKLWATQQIVNLEPGFSNLILFDINQIPNGQPANTAYSWAWLKQSPTVTKVSGNKWQLQQEWWLEAWSNILYTPF